MKKILGIIGPIGSGKDIAAEYLSHKLRIPTFQISSPLKIIAAERNIEPTRQNLIALGTTIANEKGPAFLAEYILEQIPTIWIITGMRQLAQIEYLRNNSDFLLLSIDAAPDLRFDRCRTRNKIGEETTLKNFIVKEQEENSGANVQRLFECMKLADISFVNDWDIQSLYAWIDENIVPKFHK